MSGARGRLLLGARRRQRGRGGQVLRLDRGRAASAGRRRRALLALLGRRRGPELRGPQHPVRAPATRTSDPESRARRAATPLRGARAARAAGPRRQAPDRLERADDLRARRAGAALDRADYVEAARARADFVLERMRATGRLLRTYRDGRASLTPTSRTTPSWSRRCWSSTRRRSSRAGSPRRVRSPTRCASASRTPTAAVSSRPPPATSELVVRPKAFEDHPIPSGNSSAALALLRLAAFTGDRLRTPGALPVPRAAPGRRATSAGLRAPAAGDALPFRPTPRNRSGGRRPRALPAALHSSYRAALVVAGPRPATRSQGSDPPTARPRTGQRPTGRLRLPKLHLPPTGDDPR